jgi:hypothetical protein
MAERQSISAISPPRAAAFGVLDFEIGTNPAVANSDVGRKTTPGLSARPQPEPPAGGSWEYVAAWFKDRRPEGPSWLVSLLFHIAALILLASILLPVERGDGFFGTTLTSGVIGSENGSIDATEIGPDVLPAPIGPQEPELPQLAIASSHSGDLDLSGSVPPRGVAPPAPAALDSEPEHEPQDGPAGTSEGRGKAPRAAPRKPAGAREQPANVEGLLAGRSPDARAKLVKLGGGTKESERAVELGLEWLARHQRADGSWSFQHGPDDPGFLDCPTGATGFALLCFLGAGNTSKEGPYRSHVTAGLKYLIDHMEISDNGAWLLGTGQATMYVQGVGTIALCEAYSMSKDPDLRVPAQKAVDFIVKAQDPEGGGWRYRIPQAGDLSVVGWQMMALQSARIAELSIPPRCITKATRFIRSVESESGAAFGYNNANTVRPTMTAVGLLCRMYLGRERTHKGLVRGTRRLSDAGPNPADMYFNYYATQVLHHFGGSGWEKWNAVMRDLLVSTQAQGGNAAGSWAPDLSHGVAQGGRLYTTCLSILTLEVYYRHLSLYRRQGDPDEPGAQADAGAKK